MRRLRVAVDATALLDVPTGIGRFTAEVVTGMSRRHRDLALVTFAVSWRGRQRLTAVVPPEVAVVTRPMAARPLRAAWSRFHHPRIERWTGPIDLVVGPNFVVPPAAAASVVTVHDLAFWHHPELCTGAARDYPALVRRALAAGAWVHTPSNFVREEVIELLGADPDRVVAVPNGVTAITAGSAERGCAVARATRYLLAVGTVEPRKDLPTLVRAFDELAASRPGLALVLAGPDGWGVDQLEAALAAARHRDRVVRLGFVSETDRADLLAGARAVAVPSLYEGFGLPAAEAMAAGVPVVASAAGALPEVVGDAGLLVAPGDDRALAAALARALDDDDLHADLARRGPVHAARFGWEATVDALAALWRRAVAESPERRR